MQILPGPLGMKGCIEMCIRDRKQPHKVVQLIWCILLILFPIALLFTNSSMSNLQSVSIIAAFPIGMVMILIVISFFKDVEKYKKDLDNSQKQTK